MNAARGRHIVIDANTELAPANVSDVGIAMSRGSADRFAKGLLISDLGGTPEQAADVRHRLTAFAEDWDDPTMDVYDTVLVV